MTGEYSSNPMKVQISWLAVILGIWLVGCSSGTPAISSSPSPEPTPEFLGQMLPISAEATIAGEIFELEVARTPEQQALGLMFRPALAENRGMLFPFDPPRPVGFWMKNVPVSLDMIFLLENEVKAIAANVPPCTKEPCPTYGPATPIDRVLELRAGRAGQLGLRVGDRISIQFFDRNTDQPD